MFNYSWCEFLIWCKRLLCWFQSFYHFFEKISYSNKFIWKLFKVFSLAFSNLMLLKENCVVHCKTDSRLDLLNSYFFLKWQPGKVCCIGQNRSGDRFANYATCARSSHLKCVIVFWLAFTTWASITVQQNKWLTSFHRKQKQFLFIPLCDSN